MEREVGFVRAVCRGTAVRLSQNPEHSQLVCPRNLANASARISGAELSVRFVVTSALSATKKGEQRLSESFGEISSSFPVPTSSFFLLCSDITVYTMSYRINYKRERVVEALLPYIWIVSMYITQFI